MHLESGISVAIVKSYFGLEGCGFNQLDEIGLAFVWCRDFSNKWRRLVVYAPWFCLQFIRIRVLSIKEI